MNDRIHQVMDESVDDAVITLFADMGVAIVRAPDPQGSLELAGVLGFAGDSLRGTLVVATGDELVELDPDAASASDWIAEMANQVVGRFKRRMGRFGVSMDLATPVALFGIGLRLEPSRTGEVRTYAFDGDAQVCVWLHVLVDEGLTLEETPAEVVVEEGEMMLF